MTEKSNKKDIITADKCKKKTHNETYINPYNLLLLPPTMPMPMLMNRQIQPNPSSSQPNLLLLIQTHTRIIPLEKRRISPLRTGILRQLRRLRDAHFALLFREFCFRCRGGLTEDFSDSEV